MNISMLLALVRKDILLYFKNRFFALMTILGLVIYIVLFYLLPKSVDENIYLGWYAPSLPEEVSQYVG